MLTTFFLMAAAAITGKDEDFIVFLFFIFLPVFLSLFVDLSVKVRLNVCFSSKFTVIDYFKTSFFFKIF